MLKEIFNDESINDALNYLLSKKESTGLDGMSTHQLIDFIKS